MKVKTRLHGVWVPWPCLNYTKIIGEGGQTNWKYLIDIKLFLMCLSNSEREVFTLKRPPCAELLGLTVIWNTSIKESESLKIHYEQILDSAFSLKVKTRISWMFPFWKFSWKQDDLSVKSKKLLTKYPHREADYQFAPEAEVLLYLAEGLSCRKYKTFS